MKQHSMWNMALPMIKAAGNELYGQIMMPLSLNLCERCDGILRLEGKSDGADQEVAEFKKLGRRIFHSIDEIP